MAVLRTVFIGLGTLSFLGAIAVGFYREISPVIMLSLASYLGVAVAGVIYAQGRIRDIDLDLEKTSTEIEITTMDLTQSEKHAEKMYKINNNELRRYYDLSIRQSNLVLFLAIGCILLGIGIPGGIAFMIVNGKIAESAQLVTALLGGLSSILSTFVAAVLINISSQVSTTFREFQAKLVETNRLLMANVWMSKISNEATLQDAYKEVAKILAAK